ncbi:lytic transglycosylase domain-containing protein, partial [Variovorax soli]
PGAGGAAGAGEAPAASAAPGANTVNGVDMTPGANGDISPKQVADAYRNEIEAASKETGIPPGILAGQIWQESRGKPNTPGGGLMQIQPSEFQASGGGDINNAADNIMAGAKYMQQMQEKYPDIPLALRAYNSGPNGVDPSNPNAIPAGTGDATYVTKVLKAAEESGLRTS